MQNFEFYDHDIPLKWNPAPEKIISCANIGNAVALISKEENQKLLLRIQHFKKPENNTTFSIQNNTYVSEIDYDIGEDLAFFSTSDMYFVLKDSTILFQDKWDGKVSGIKLGPGMMLAIYYENSIVASCSLLPSGKLDSKTFNYDGAVFASDSNDDISCGEGEDSEVFHGRATIAWASDGKLFAVNSARNTEGCLIVYTKNCQILHKLELTMNYELQKSIIWPPDGYIIACIQSRTESKRKLIGMTKQLNIIYALKLKDNADVQRIESLHSHNILAILQKSNNNSWLDLFIIKKERFYLKQRLPFNKENALLNFTFTISLENMFNIQLIFENSVFQYTFLKKNTKTMCSHYGLNATCDIDGNTMELTYYKKGETAMTSNTLRVAVCCQDCILTVVFDPCRTVLAVITISYEVSIFNYPDSVCVLLSKFSLDANEVTKPFTYYRFFFEPNGNFCAIRMGKLNDTIYYYSTLNSALLKTEKCPKKIMNGQNIIKHTGRFRSLGLKPILDIPITEYIRYEFESKEYSITKNCHGMLKVNDTQLNGIFTSVHFTDTHMFLIRKEDLLDNLNDYLLVLELNESIFESLVGCSNFVKFDYIQPVEKGALILNNITGTSVIILLLASDKKHYISVRSISLKILNNALLSKDFKKAYNIIIFDSLDLNLLVDLHPTLFIKYFEKIIKFLCQVGALHIFLINLTNNSTLKAEEKKEFNSEDMENKRSKVCSMILEFILNWNEPVKYLFEVSLAALCCQSEGYNSIKMAETISFVVGQDFGQYKDEIVKAVDSLSLHISYENQYLAILAAYNLDIAELVAQRSEMLPHQYQPFLKKLRKLSDLYCRHKICTFLGKSTEASMYYLEMFDEEEISLDDLLTYAKKNNCFELYYKELLKWDRLVPKIAENYALELSNKQEYKEAGIIMNSIKMHREACKIFMKGLFWEEAIAALYLISNMSKSEKKRQLQVIAQKLKSCQRFKDAGNVYLKFCKDQQSAINSYLEGLHFKDAYLLMLKVNNISIKKILVPKMKESIKDMVIRLVDKYDHYMLAYGKLKDLREIIKRQHIREMSWLHFPDGSLKTLRFCLSGNLAQPNNESMSDSASESPKNKDIEVMVQLYKLVEDAFDIIYSIEENTSILEQIIQTSAFNLPILKNVYNIKKKIADTADEIWAEKFVRFSPKDREEAAFVNIIRLDLKYRCKPPVLHNLNLKMDYNYLN